MDLNFQVVLVSPYPLNYNALEKSPRRKSFFVKQLYGYAVAKTSCGNESGGRDTMFLNTSII